MQDLISIVIPVYNVEKYLERCMLSILNQTYSGAMEIILVDDGSTDNSGELCDYYENNYVNIRVIHKENGGLSDARNHGIKVSRGNLISFIDSDDVIDKCYIEKLYNNLITYEADISLVRYCRFYDLSELENIDIEEEIEIYSPMQAVEKMFYTPESIPQSACCKIYKRTLFDEISYPKGRLNEDIGTTYKLFAKAGKIVSSNLPLYFYFQRIGSIVRSDFTSSRMDAIYFSEEIIEYINKYMPKIKKSAICFALAQNIQVLMKLPYEDPSFETYLKYIISNIKRYRATVIFDSKVTWQRRLGALSTFGGVRVSIKLGQLYKRKVNHENVL